MYKHKELGLLFLDIHSRRVKKFGSSKDDNKWKYSVMCPQKCLCSHSVECLWCKKTNKLPANYKQKGYNDKKGRSEIPGVKIPIQDRNCSDCSNTGAERILRWRHHRDTWPVVKVSWPCPLHLKAGCLKGFLFDVNLPKSSFHSMEQKESSFTPMSNLAEAKKRQLNQTKLCRNVNNIKSNFFSFVFLCKRGVSWRSSLSNIPMLKESLSWHHFTGLNLSSWIVVLNPHISSSSR